MKMPAELEDYHLPDFCLPQATFNNWIKSLESEEFVQCQGGLDGENQDELDDFFKEWNYDLMRSEDVCETGHCCLGVLKEVDDSIQTLSEASGNSGFLFYKQQKKNHRILPANLQELLSDWNDNQWMSFYEIAQGLKVLRKLGKV